VISSNLTATCGETILVLNSYGTIMAFAIDLEGQLQQFYQHIAGADEAFADYARRYTKRKTRIAQVRQEYVTEIVLEPISGLNAEDYALTPDLTVSSKAAMIAEAIRLEETAERFYAETSQKLNVTEAIRTFQKFASENAERLEELKSFGS
jgi:rubrerythrin